MDNDNITLEETTQMKVAKPPMYIGNRIDLENWFLQMDIYFVFNQGEERQKALFATTRMRGKVMKWIKSTMIQHLNNGRNSTRIFSNYDNFKREIRIVFEVTNEVVTFKRVVQYLIQKTFAIDYAQRFKVHSNKTNWNDNFKMHMFKRELKVNIKEELVRKGETYKSFNELIIIAIEIDDAWYDFNLQKRFEKFEFERAKLFQEGLTKYREERLIKERSYDDEIVSMELNSIEKLKGRRHKRQ